MSGFDLQVPRSDVPRAVLDLVHLVDELAVQGCIDERIQVLHSGGAAMS